MNIEEAKALFERYKLHPITQRKRKARELDKVKRLEWEKIARELRAKGYG